MAATTWDDYCTTVAMLQKRTRQPRQPPPADLLDFSFAVDHLRLEAANLVHLLRQAEAAECERAPVLRAHLADLRHMQAELAALVAEAEAAQ